VVFLLHFSSSSFFLLAEKQGRDRVAEWIDRAWCVGMAEHGLEAVAGGVMVERRQAAAAAE
jgi:hypothetical protein